MYLAIEKCEGNLDNLVQLMKVGKKDKKLWETLPLSNVYLETPKKLYDPEEVRKIMWQTLNGLKFLHDNNIVHRDVKPQNILMNRLCDIKLSDMGLSKQLLDD